MEELLENMDWELFERQKEWLAKQVAALEPSGSEVSGFPEGILNMMDRIQEIWEGRIMQSKSRSFSVVTQKGTITARESFDDDYPGIYLIYSEPGTGEPGALMEYDPMNDAIMLRVWDRQHVDGDPVFTRKIGE